MEGSDQGRFVQSTLAIEAQLGGPGLAVTRVAQCAEGHHSQRICFVIRAASASVFDKLLDSEAQV